MNVFEAIYCSQYYELKKTGRDPMKGRTNGTIFIAAIVMLVIISVIVLIAHFSPGGSMSRFFRGTGLSGRSTGKILGLGGIAIIGAILHFTIGSKSSYQKMIARWEQLPDDVLKGSGKKALITFGVVFVIFLLVMFSNFL